MLNKAKNDRVPVLQGKTEEEKIENLYRAIEQLWSRVVSSEIEIKNLKSKIRD